MADSPQEMPHPIDKETVPIAPADSDVEAGDQGIVVHAAPLSRKLKGRHMQMIAIGIYSYRLTKGPQLTIISPRWCNWSWVVRRFWKCFGDWGTWKLGTCDTLLLLQGTCHDIPTSSIDLRTTLLHILLSFCRNIGHWIHHYRFYAPRHSPSPWRTRCLVSRQRSLLHLRCALRRPVSVRIKSFMGYNIANAGKKVALQLDGIMQSDGLQFFLSSSRQRVLQFSSGGLTSTSG